MGYAIWTFDLVTRHMPVGSTIKTSFPDCVYWEACPGDWTRDQAAQRAARLSATHDGLFIVRHLLGDGVWSAPTADEWRDGIAAVHRREREREGQVRQQRLQRKISRTGVSASNS